MSGTVEFAKCGSRARRRGICSPCFRFLPGFELSVLELRFGRDVSREVTRWKM